MVFYCACIHPDPEDQESQDAMPTGYWLSRCNLLELRASMVGIPITYEHVGIRKAVHRAGMTDLMISGDAVRYQLEQLADANIPGHCVLGSVTDCWEARDGSWWATFFIQPVYKAVHWLLTHAHLTGVSLTHTYNDDNTIVPLELSLCREPARPGCYIYRRYTNVIDANTYKRLRQSCSIPDTPTMSTETPDASTPSGDPPLSEIESVLHKMDPTDRRLIEDRLIAASTNMKTAVERMKEAERRAGVSTSALRNQIDILKAHINPELLQTYSIATPDDLQSLYSNNVQEMHPTLNRVLVAASATIMQLKSGLLHKQGEEERVHKRTRADPPVQALNTNTPTSTPARDSRTAALQSAISDAFDML